MSPFVYILLLYLKLSNGADTNVGTVLFTHADAYKECWSSENLAILTSRMILEDLLPSPSILVIDCNEFVTDLVEYFRLILQTVRETTHGKSKHITLVALADLLGGYLHHAVLPIARYSYYAGLINYQSISSLITLYEELREFLRTNGHGWARPITQNLENFEVPRIPLQNNRREKDACQNIILVERDDNTIADSKVGEVSRNGIIPIPFFDSNTKPSAIALPTKSGPLHSLESNTSNFLIMKFFVNAYQCLLSKNTRPENMARFENDMSQWIENEIMPRLEDEKLYPAFGGILRVRLTLRRLGVSQKEFSEQIDEFKQLSQDNEKVIVEEQAQKEKMSKSAMILMAILITIFLWFILGVSFICYRMRAAKMKKDMDECNCPPDDHKTTTCSSLVSSKYFYPEKPKADRKSSAHGSRGCCVVGGKGRQSHHQIKITTCQCDHSDSNGVEDKHQARLTSITEMSEQSTNTGQKHNQKRGKKVAIGGSSTADGSSSEIRPPHQVNSEQYFETSDSEETSTEGN